MSLNEVMKHLQGQHPQQSHAGSRGSSNWDDLPPGIVMEARPYNKKNQKKPVETIEYKYDTENRKVLSKRGDKIEELEVGDYFKKDDKLNFDNAMTTHRDKIAIREDWFFTEAGKTGSGVPGASLIEKTRRESARSASRMMKGQKR